MDKEVIDIDYEVIDKKEINDIEDEKTTENSQNYDSQQSNAHYYSTSTDSGSLCLIIPLILFILLVIFAMVFM